MAIKGHPLGTLQIRSGMATEVGCVRVFGEQLPTETEGAEGAEEQEEWTNETRLVPTEVWEEEQVERLDHRTVTEERSVPQVIPLYNHVHYL